MTNYKRSNEFAVECRVVKKRAQFKHFVLVLFLLQRAPALSGAAAEMPRLEANADAMGSTYPIVWYDEDRNKMESAADEALEKARRLDRLLSNDRPESEWSGVSREAADRPVEVSRELPGEIERARGQIGYRNIVLDASRQTVFFLPGGSEPRSGGCGHKVTRWTKWLKS